MIKLNIRLLAFSILALSGNKLSCCHGWTDDDKSAAILIASTAAHIMKTDLRNAIEVIQSLPTDSKLGADSDDDLPDDLSGAMSILTCEAVSKFTPNIHWDHFVHTVLGRANDDWQDCCQWTQREVGLVDSILTKYGAFADATAQVEEMLANLSVIQANCVNSDFSTEHGVLTLLSFVSRNITYHVHWKRFIKETWPRFVGQYQYELIHKFGRQVHQGLLLAFDQIGAIHALNHPQTQGE